ncbi:hypothetical protein BJ138DRAFT_1139626 [Hygrophoropsis aurantiaca]|uniref:Uncharacterized protein n=1 Tax=Hygrophoropsis aurantiaca TaxID=72124 RepID=A0ACB8ASQ9_9AGAM|nr:hypothetical protein BJ138DRAFT_1139626 [Hygrophoropsis aurantiaca]
MPGGTRPQYHGYRHPFVNGRLYHGVWDSPHTLVDQAMSKLSATLRQEPQWWNRVHDQDARIEWTTKACNHTWTVRTPTDAIQVPLYLHQINYVLDELEGYANLCDTQNNCYPSCFERIWERLLPQEEPLIVRLNRRLSSLRDEKAWRTNSDGTSTVDLIDPFFHALVYTRTYAYDSENPKGLRPEPQPLKFDPENPVAVSKSFSCLPTDFKVSPTGTIKGISYINDLHPRYTSLYDDIENLLGATIPLFEHVLTDLHRENPMRRRIKAPLKLLGEPIPPDFSNDELGWASYESRAREWVMNKPIQLPDVPSAGYTEGLEHRKHLVELRGRALQFIIRVSDTRIEPGKTSYHPGSPWHVEGMKNERIVACAFYYLIAENLADNHINFRMAVTAPQGDIDTIHRIYGLKKGDPCHQYVGSVPIHAGLCIAFPNIYQVQQTPIHLANPSQGGHQRVIQFFLVDPDIPPIISTSRVLPQQLRWMVDLIHSSHRFPLELSENIAKEVDGLLSKEEAEKFRDQMIVNRTAYNMLCELQYFCIPLNEP